MNATAAFVCRWRQSGRAESNDREMTAERAGEDCLDGGCCAYCGCMDTVRTVTLVSDATMALGHALAGAPPPSDWSIDLMYILINIYCRFNQDMERDARARYRSTRLIC